MAEVQRHPPTVLPGEWSCRACRRLLELWQMAVGPPGRRDEKTRWGLQWIYRIYLYIYIVIYRYIYDIVSCLVCFSGLEIRRGF